MCFLSHDVLVHRVNLALNDERIGTKHGGYEMV
jgi:hypothetical protein